MKKTKFKQTEIGKIPEDWEVKSIGNVAEVIGGGTPSTKTLEYWGGNIAWITPRDLSNFKFRYVKKGNKSITKEGLKNSSAKLLPKGTVLLTTRAPVGYLAIANNEVTTNQGFRNLISTNKTISKFLFYLLKNNVNLLKSNATGTTFMELSGSRLKSLMFAFPPFPEQKAIASILSSLDEKIELNNRMNETLEAIGQAIFKKWFVYIEKIPKEWETKSLLEIADYLNGLALQKYPPKGEDDLSVIKIRELKNGITENTDKANSDLPQNYIIKDGDILFSWSGSLEVVIWGNGWGALNQHLFKVTSKKYPKWFYYYWTLNHLQEFKMIAEGKATTMGHIKRHHLDDAKCLVPDEETFGKMSKIMSPLIEMQIKNKIEVRKLSEIRDVLLPKLMSGKVRVR